MPQGLHYVYETKRCFGQGLVIGSMEIARNYSFNSVDEIPDYYIIAGCVPRDFLEAYAKGRKLYANIISDKKLFRHLAYSLVRLHELATKPLFHPHLNAQVVHC